MQLCTGNSFSRVIADGWVGFFCCCVCVCVDGGGVSRRARRTGAVN